MTDPGFPVFDADNHLYESPAWLDYLPKRHARDIQFVEVRGRTRLAMKGKLTEFIPNPTFDRVARPGAHIPYYSGNNPEGLTPPGDDRPADRVSFPRSASPVPASSCSTSWASNAH